MLRRETIIALRARHTAFRMALDILYPQQSRQRPPRSDSVIAATDICFREADSRPAGLAATERARHDPSTVTDAGGR